MPQPPTPDPPPTAQAEEPYQDPRTWGRRQRTRPSWNQRLENKYGVIAIVLIVLVLSRYLPALERLVEGLQPRQQGQAAYQSPVAVPPVEHRP